MLNSMKLVFIVSVSISRSVSLLAIIGKARVSPVLNLAISQRGTECWPFWYMNCLVSKHPVPLETIVVALMLVFKARAPFWYMNCPSRFSITSQTLLASGVPSASKNCSNLVHHPLKSVPSNLGHSSLLPFPEAPKAIGCSLKCTLPPAAMDGSVCT
ncbi:hypothetical protein V6Z12_D06G043500 [Gossypium hirsutum]